MKKFVLGLIVGLLIPAIGGYLYIKMGMMYITAEQVEKIGHSMQNNSYGAYLLQLLREKVF